ncbi:TPA: hypothetical protein PC598_001381 [Morganella morganii]|nr:hypothetical protein [Morganella morganii]
MPFQIGNRFFPDEISNNRIDKIARSDTQPEVSLWERIKEFFCFTKKPEVENLIWKIMHPLESSSDEIGWDMMIKRFERLKALASDGHKDRIEIRPDGEDSARILDKDNDEMLSVTFDKNTMNCTLKWPEGCRTVYLDPNQGVEEGVEPNTETYQPDQAATLSPQPV